jgi:hypothetical protein
MVAERRSGKFAYGTHGLWTVDADDNVVRVSARGTLVLSLWDGQATVCFSGEYPWHNLMFIDELSILLAAAFDRPGRSFSAVNDFHGAGNLVSYDTGKRWSLFAREAVVAPSADDGRGICKTYTFKRPLSKCGFGAWACPGPDDTDVSPSVWNADFSAERTEGDEVFDKAHRASNAYRHLRLLEADGIDCTGILRQPSAAYVA